MLTANVLLWQASISLQITIFWVWRREVW